MRSRQRERSKIFQFPKEPAKADFEARRLPSIKLLGLAAMAGVGVGFGASERIGWLELTRSPEVFSEFYSNCTDARLSGAAPIRSGEPGYRPQLDRDGDGVACEPYSRSSW